MVRMNKLLKLIFDRFFGCSRDVDLGRDLSLRRRPRMRIPLAILVLSSAASTLAQLAVVSGSFSVLNSVGITSASSESVAFLLPPCELQVNL